MQAFVLINFELVGFFQVASVPRISRIKTQMGGFLAFLTWSLTITLFLLVSTLFARWWLPRRHDMTFEGLADAGGGSA